jgi:hypothetical protein
MELLKIILNFISSIAYPLVLGMLLILFRKEIGGALEILRQFFLKVKEGFESGRLDIAYGPFTARVAQKILSENPDSAAKTIQDLLSPAAPLALGYVDNFLQGLVVAGDGGFEFLPDPQLGRYQIEKIFTIYIPRELPEDAASSPSLVEAEYRNEKIKNISIQSKYGRSFTAFAILRNTTLYPVDVPKTLTSIQQVFRYREKQLEIDAKMDAVQIQALEGKNLETFADIIRDRTKSLQASRCIRIIRERSALFSLDASAPVSAASSRFYQVPMA